MDFNIISKNVEYDNISSNFNFQCPGLNVKVTAAFKYLEHVRHSGSWAQGQGHCGYF